MSEAKKSDSTGQLGAGDETRMLPQGTLLRSAKWGLRVLHRPSAMRPGAKCMVRYRGVGERPIWLPADDFTVEAPNVGIEPVTPAREQR